MNSSGRCGAAKAGLYVGGFGQDCLGPSPSSCTSSWGWGLRVGGGFSSAISPSSPSPALAQLPRLFSESRLPVFFLSDGKSGTTRGEWDHPHFQSLAETETKASLNKDPYNPKIKNKQTNIPSIMVTSLPSPPAQTAALMSCLPVKS